MDDAASAGTVGRALAGTLVRTVLKLAGTALVTRGLTDQGTVDGLVPALTEVLTGAIIVGAATGWSLFRTWLSHTRWARDLARPR